MKTKGFSNAYTLVELILMIFIIGVLVGITVIGIGSWRTRVAETEVKSDLANLRAGMEDARNRTNGYPTFPGGTEFDGGNGTDDIFTQSEHVAITYNRGDTTYYCVDVRSIERPNIYMFFNTTGGNGAPQVGTCDGGPGATPPTPDQTIFVFDTAAPGCTGTVQLPVSAPASGGTVNWGDGTTQARTGSLMAHTYSTPGVYTATYVGPLTQANYEYAVNSINAKCLTRVQQWGNDASPTKVSFYNATNLVHVAEPPHTVTSMRGIFNGAIHFNQPIGHWDVSKVTDMGYMFANAQAFSQPLGSWNVSGARYMNNMFENADSFNQPIGSWNVSNVWDMFMMFQDNGTFNQPIGSWNVSSVTRTTGMFRGASAFNQPIGSWNVSNVTDMGSMFNSATAFNQPIGGWNVSKVTNMNVMFAGATSFNQPLGSWNVSNVRDNLAFYGMFSGASSFNQNISGWNVISPINAQYFHSGSPLTQVNCPPLLW